MNRYLEYMLSDSESETLGLPGGVLMQSGRSLEKLEKLTSEVGQVFARAGYTKVVPPVFEYYETFEHGGGAEIARRSFTFKDREGLLLALRYDMTTPIARMVAMQTDSASEPKRLAYSGDVFREQPLHKGKIRQIPQAGIELFGLTGANADAEAVKLLAGSLAVLDKDYKIVMGCVGLYQTLLSQLELTSSTKQAIHASIERKDRVSLEILLKDIQGQDQIRQALIDLPFLAGKPDQLKKKTAELPQVWKIHADAVYEVFDLLDEKIKDHVIIDLGLIKDFTYYTGLTLEGYISSGGSAVANGGRYDGLFRAFGRDYPAVGFALDLGYLFENSDQ